MNHASREHSFTNGGSLLDKTPRTMWETHDDVTTDLPVSERLRNISLQLDTINQKFDTKAEEGPGPRGRAEGVESSRLYFRQNFYVLLLCRGNDRLCTRICHVALKPGILETYDYRFNLHFRRIFAAPITV